VAGTKKRRSYRTKKRVKEWLSLQYRNIDYRDETLGSGTAPKEILPCGLSVTLQARWYEIGASHAAIAL
jgi:hypothetical protein